MAHLPLAERATTTVYTTGEHCAMCAAAHAWAGLGRVVYAAPFRSYGGVVIVDHGGGWTTTITDLRSLNVASGASVVRGETLGAARRDRPEITVELRRAGRPVPIASVL